MQQLIKGETHEVWEYFRMSRLKGKLIGIEKSWPHGSVKDTLIFEKIYPEYGSKYFGAVWELSGNALNPKLQLINVSNGNSPDELKLCPEFGVPNQKRIKIFAENEN